MKFHGVVIYLVKPRKQELLLFRIFLYLVLIRGASNFYMNCSFSFSAKAKKRPAGADKRGLFSEEEIPESKRPRLSPAPFSDGLGEGSRPNTPVLTRNEKSPQGSEKVPHE